ncbi:hypothetical protein WR25_13724 isoform C [Diploscapter pachys]|uniref:Uncharacterized protein n=1 Tax=Diploscapter pachys TaxID=2018661 RepID=A0A2A2J6U7_9BILA|nr:hypothetical protein WR25_13724 isoform C [Diploscapter pachys]
MVEVTPSNFHELLPEIEKAIEQAAFVGFDFELLGLPTAVDASSMTLFDSVECRYKKLRRAVQQIPPCQFGIACFQQQSNKIVVKSYWFPLFKPSGSSSFSYSALKFLSDNGYGFDKWIRNGLPYSNQDELSADLNKIFAEDLDSLPNFKEMRSKADWAKLLILSLGKFNTMDPSENDHSLVINMSSETIIDEREELTPSNFWQSKPSRLEANYILYCLNEDLKPLRVEFANDDMTLLKVTPNWKNEFEYREEMKKMVKEISDGICGVSLVFRVLVRHKVKLVGHNSLLDHMYLYQAFYRNLPETYVEWKKSVSNNFSTIFDTKILAKEMAKVLSEYGQREHALHSLIAFFAEPRSRLLLPQKMCKIEYSLPERGDHALKLHNSAYDAAMTGEMFYKLSLVCMKEAKLQDLSLDQLVSFVSPLCDNRIPLPLIDSSFCNLIGPDPEGVRPDVIRLVKRQPNSKFTSLLPRCFFGYAKICSAKMSDLRIFLSAALGSFRFDIRLVEDGRVLEVATNTASTYAHLCSYFGKHDDFEIVCAGRQTRGERAFEENLLAHRVEKTLRKNNYSYRQNNRLVTFLPSEETSLK